MFLTGFASLSLSGAFVDIEDGWTGVVEKHPGVESTSSISGKLCGYLRLVFCKLVLALLCNLLSLPDFGLSRKHLLYINVSSSKWLIVIIVLIENFLIN